MGEPSPKRKVEFCSKVSPPRSALCPLSIEYHPHSVLGAGLRHREDGQPLDGQVIGAVIDRLPAE